ncbi:serine/threonine-protein kinase [Cellvibrio sp. pealriver]|uniref:serine/threonine-protein kinase n=1 Tax=Cellvibrio sp. pealriver TaxID=1622269 RepID=UPI00069E5812|nr:serine/threonine-protein kinase [Cellvibrio sp. pealriver]
MDANVITPISTSQKNHIETSVTHVSALSIGKKLKEYRITGVIGEGGFGIVYAAEDTLLNRNVAIKEYMPSSIANRLASSNINVRSTRHKKAFDAGMQGFIDEARLLAQFKHPALVEILRFWEENNTAYMVMPHYSGQTLRSFLRKNKSQCTENWLKKILSPILNAVELLHKNNIYHRDIAPDNIVIQDNNRPVLLDLGSARRVIAGMQSALTVVVKPGYAPIEQYTEDTAEDQGPWTDIYALGAVLYFAITGAAPSASVSRMMRDTLKPLTQQDHPQFSEEFLTAINQALQLRPIDRFQTISEFRENLKLDSFNTQNAPLAWQSNKTGLTEKNNDDDEITQILTEDEINQFKEKLLNTLSCKNQRQQAPLSMPIKIQSDENVLLNSPEVREKSINSFGDVKELLEKKPIQKPGNATSKSTKVTPQTQLQSNPAAKKTAKKISSAHKLMTLPLIIGCGTFLALFAGTVYLLNKSDIKSYELSESQLPSSSIAAAQNTTIATPTASTDSQIDVYIPDEYSLSQPTTHLTLNDFDNADNISAQAAQLTPAQQTVITDESIESKAQDISMRSSITIESDNKTSNAINSESPKNNQRNNAIQQDQLKKLTDKKIILGTAKLTLLPWGEVWVDNQRYGVSPPVQELSLAPGTYRVELRNPGLPAHIRTVTISEGENPAIYHNFSAPESADNSQATDTPANQIPAGKNQPSKANEHTITPETSHLPSTATAITHERTLNIKVLPWGEIYIDGKMVGVTPPLHQLALKPGNHSIEIRHPNYAPKTIVISANDPLNMPIEHQFK